MTYHISSKNTVGVCEAQPGNCPLGGFHFVTEREARTETQRRNINLGCELTQNPEDVVVHPPVLERATIWSKYDLDNPTDKEKQEYIQGFNLSVQKNVFKREVNVLLEKPLEDPKTKGVLRADILFNRINSDFPEKTFHTYSPSSPSIQAAPLNDEVLELPDGYPKFKVENKNGVLVTKIVQKAVTGLVYRVTEAKFEQHPETKEYRYTLPRLFVQDSIGGKYVVEVKAKLFEANNLPILENPPVVHKASN